MKEEYPPARMVKFTMIRWGNNREASVYIECHYETCARRGDGDDMDKVTRQRNDN